VRKQFDLEVLLIEENFRRELEREKIKQTKKTAVKNRKITAVEKK
jgi:hypothetical protein